MNAVEDRPPEAGEPLPEAAVAMGRRRCAAALVLLAAWTLAALESGGKTLIPASMWVTALGLLGAALVFPLLERRRWKWMLPVGLLLLALVATQIHLRHGSPRTHDGRLHVWAVWTVHRCQLDGDPYPRWNPYMALGMPLLQFYPPVSYLLAQPFLYLGLTPLQTAAALALLSAWLAGLTTAWSAGRLGLGWQARYLAAGALLFSPYRLLDTNYRFALAEMVSFVVVPPFIVLGREVARGIGGARSRYLFVATAAALILTHLLSAMTAGIALGIWLILEAVLARFRNPRQWLLGFLRLGLLCLVAAGCVGAYLVPAVTEVGHTQVKRFVAKPSRPLSVEAIGLDDLFERYALPSFHSTRRHPQPGQDPNHMIPFYFGLTLLGLAAAAVVLTAKRRDIGKTAPPAAVGGLILALVLCLLFSAGIPRWVLDNIRPLRALQFPWRFLGPAVVAAALAAGMALEHYGIPPRWRAVLGAVLLGALVIDAFPYLGAADWIDSYRGVAHMLRVGKGATYADRFDPVEVQLPTDRFIRTEQLLYPPARFDLRVANAYSAQQEYMTEAIYRRYLLERGKKNKGEKVSARYGVSYRFEGRLEEPRALKASALASLMPEGGRRFADLAEEPYILPERIVVQLPGEHGKGTLRVLFQAFPGWIYREDDGPWQPALDLKGVLGARVADHTRQVEFRYSWRTSARLVGAILSICFLCGLLFVGANQVCRARRQRDRTAS